MAHIGFLKGGVPPAPPTASVLTTQGATGSTTRTFNLPTTVAGDLLILYAVANGVNISAGPAGWTQMWQNTDAAAYFKRCTGSEGSTASYTVSGSSNPSLATVVKATGPDTTTDPVFGNLRATNAAPNPPSVSAGWAAGINNLVLASAQAQSSVNAGVAGYTLLDTSSFGGASQSVYTLATTVVANDPGAFTINASGSNMAGTVVVKGT